MKAKKGGRQLQTKNQIRVVTCKMYLFLLYFVNYMIFITSKCFMENLSHFRVQFCIEKV